MNITRHAILKFKERSESGESLLGLSDKLLAMFKRAKVFEPPVGFRVRSLMNHGYSATSYYKFNFWVFIDGDLITVTDILGMEDIKGTYKIKKL